jgi:hypothetical protein
MGMVRCSTEKAVSFLKAWREIQPIALAPTAAIFPAQFSCLFSWPFSTSSDPWATQRQLIFGGLIFKCESIVIITTVDNTKKLGSFRIFFLAGMNAK